MKPHIKIDCEPLPMFTERKRKLPEQQIGSLSRMPSENAINCDLEIYENNRADNFEKTDDTRKVNGKEYQKFTGKSYHTQSY